MPERDLSKDSNDITIAWVKIYPRQSTLFKYGTAMDPIHVRGDNIYDNVYQNGRHATILQWPSYAANLCILYLERGQMLIVY